MYTMNWLALCVRTKKLGHFSFSILNGVQWNTRKVAVDLSSQRGALLHSMNVYVAVETDYITFYIHSASVRRSIHDHRSAQTASSCCATAQIHSNVLTMISTSQLTLVLNFEFIKNVREKNHVVRQARMNKCKRNLMKMHTEIWSPLLTAATFQCWSVFFFLS